eukprot:TRINITY_DN12223_c0_g1_i1.p1 TRINITY_DN12223_c0_g1~~TRINITY_DN12223_c0_g1_i1.p1  ORF type:complete len:452 (-),score=15.06 TRINITY_DN12223_c0_g1_i1:41-1396(-)
MWASMDKAGKPEGCFEPSLFNYLRKSFPATMGHLQADTEKKDSLEPSFLSSGRTVNTVTPSLPEWMTLSDLINHPQGSTSISSRESKKPFLESSTRERSKIGAHVRVESMIYRRNKRYKASSAEEEKNPMFMESTYSANRKENPLPRNVTNTFDETSNDGNGAPASRLYIQDSTPFNSDPLHSSAKSSDVYFGKNPWSSLRLLNRAECPLMRSEVCSEDSVIFGTGRDFGWLAGSRQEPRAQLAENKMNYYTGEEIMAPLSFSPLESIDMKMEGSLRSLSAFTLGPSSCKLREGAHNRSPQSYYKDNLQRKRSNREISTTDEPVSKWTYNAHSELLIHATSDSDMLKITSEGSQCQNGGGGKGTKIYCQIDADPQSVHDARSDYGIKDGDKKLISPCILPSTTSHNHSFSIASMARGELVDEECGLSTMPWLHEESCFAGYNDLDDGNIFS